MEKIAPQLKDYEKQMLIVLGVSSNDKYVNLDVHSPANVDRVFQLAKEIGISKENVVNPEFLNILFEGDKPQYLHLWPNNYHKKFFLKIIIFKIS